MASLNSKTNPKQDYTLTLAVFIGLLLLLRILTIPTPFQSLLSEEQEKQIAVAEKIEKDEAMLYTSYPSASEYLTKLAASLDPATPCEDKLTEFASQEDHLFYLDSEVSKMKDISGSESCLTLNGFPKHLVPKVAELAPSLETSVVLVTAGPSQGTGYAIASNLIVTNFHVAAGPDDKPYGSYYVTTFGGKEYTATYVGGSFTSDVAVLKIDTEMVGVTTVKIAESEASNFTYGEPLFSIGHPGGFGQWKTLVGVYYGKRMNLFDVEGPRLSIPSVSGSSGSPIFNMKGELISMIYGATPLSEGLVQRDEEAQYRDPIHTGIVSSYTLSSGIDLSEIKKIIAANTAEVDK